MLSEALGVSWEVRRGIAVKVFVSVYAAGMVIFSHGAMAQTQAADIKAPAVREGAPIEPIAETAPAEDEGEFRWLRDPFLSFLPKKKRVEEVILVSPSSSRAEMEEEEGFDYSSLEVSGLLWGAASSKAIINGEIYGIGDVINEAKIVDISKEGILFEYHGQRYLLKR